MNDTTVYIAPVDSVGTVIIDGPENIGTVIIGNDEIAVTVDEPQITVAVTPVASEPPGTIILGPDQIGTVIVGDNPVTVLIANPELTIIGSDIPGPPGPAGPPGVGEADEVTYDGAGYATVKAALDALLYVAPHINSFTNDMGTVEKGSSVASVTLSWSFNKAMTGVTLDGTSLAVSATSAIEDGPFTTDHSWALAASDGQNTANASTSIAFRQKRYWGASALDSLTDSDILALGGSEFATSFNKSVSYNCTGGKYPYLCYPASFGTPSNVTVGGLAFTDFTVTTQSFTNASGYTDSYHVVRFNGLQTGSNISVAWT